MENHALIVGATGIAGSNLAEHLLAQGGWKISGLSRSESPVKGVETLKCDLTDAQSVSRALEGVRPTHVFITAWSRQETEEQNCRVNGGIVRNVLDALRGRGVRHVALVTGTKHYLGPFESYAKVAPETPFREEQERLPNQNFYYVQEDEIFSAAEREKFTWSVHRPHTLIGYAVGNAMNMAATLGIYASICKETGMAFSFPGSAEQWQAATDVTDARMLARQLAWAGTTPAAADLAFNIVNGDIFRWNWMWGRIANWFGLEPAAFDGTIQPLEQQMAEEAPVWRQIAERYGLAEPDLSRLASPWHTDADLGRPIEVVTDMSKSRVMGFNRYQPTDEAFFTLFAQLRRDRLVP